MDPNNADLQETAKTLAQAFADVTFEEARAAMINKTTIKGFHIGSVAGERESGHITYIKLRHTTVNITIEIEDLPSQESEQEA